MNTKQCTLFKMETALNSSECPELRELIESKEVRITPLRERVYHFVRHSRDKGISAYQILDLMKKYNPKAKPATIYRSLDYLQKAGIIVKIESCSKFVKKKHLSSEIVTLFMICSNCGSIIQHTEKNIHTHIDNMVKKYGCIVQKKDIEVKVICPDCLNNG